ncbi:MAG: dTMP kinase [Polyangiaceae bacterium]|nr:dTMP kinase [Polyangiaceae bacterium]
MPRHAHTDGHDGVFVVFEGIDGAGTTTQAELYAKYLRQKKRLVHVTREPSVGPIGSLLRLILSRRVALPSGSHAQTMALLFAADRLDHVESEILPLLRDGYVILSDRYDLSSILYQAVTAGVEPSAGSDVVAWIRTLNRHARRPDVTVVVDVPPEVAEIRRRARGGAIEIFEENDIQTRLARAYLRAEHVVGDRIVHIDGTLPIEGVHNAIVAALAPFVESAD